MTNVIMPKLGLTMKEGTITQWLVAVGDTVKAGDILCEIETDKLTNKIESKVDGVVKEILVEEEETVPVLTVIAIIE